MVATWAEIVGRRQAKPAQDAQISRRDVRQGRGNRGGISQAARDLAIPRDKVRRSRAIAKLAPEAKAKAKGLGLDDNQAAPLKPKADATKVQSRQHQLYFLGVGYKTGVEGDMAMMATGETLKGDEEDRLHRKGWRRVRRERKVRLQHGTE